MAILPLLGLFLAAIMILRWRRRLSRVTNNKTFEIQLPRDDDSSHEIAANLFNNLHGIKYPWYRRIFSPQPHITLEIHSSSDIAFYISVPDESGLPKRVKSIFTSSYPNIIYRVSEEELVRRSLKTVMCQIKQVRHPIYPLRAAYFDEDDGKDPMEAITNSLVGLEPGETRTIQILIKPIGARWHSKARSIINQVRKRRTINISTNRSLWALRGLFELIGDLLFGMGEEGRQKCEGSYANSGMLTEETKKFEEAAGNKLNRNSFRVEIRLMVQSDAARYHDVEALADAFGVYTWFNCLKRNRVWFYNRGLFIKLASSRLYPIFGSQTILDSEELGSIYHPPGLRVETRGLRRAYNREKETVLDVPCKGRLIGYAVDRGRKRPVALGKADESLHVTVVGRTGMGKTEEILGLIEEGLKDRESGGLYIDPHGTAAKELCGRIDSSYLHRLYYWAPWDEDHSIGFNVLEKSDSASTEELNLICANTVDVFHASWQMKAEFVRLKHYLRYGTMTLLSYPEPMTIMELYPLFIDSSFRERILKKLDDAELLSFWHDQFAKLDKRQQIDHLMSLYDRLSTISLDRRIRRTLGQSKSQIDFVNLMDSGKFLIIDLDMGRLGEENARLLGTLIVAKVFQAALSRKHRERIFRMYLDEAENFMTLTYEKILSQSRKFGLCQYLFVQYLDQLPEEVLSAVLGNVGTLVSLRAGVRDAALLAPYFARCQEEEELSKTVEDLINLPAYQCLVKTSVDKRSTPPFRMETLPMLPPVNEDQRHYVVIKMNALARSCAEIDAEMDRRRGSENNGNNDDLEQISQDANLGSVKGDLTPKEKEALAQVQRMGIATSRDIEDSLGWKQPLAYKRLNKLVQLGYLKKFKEEADASKPFYYRLTAKAKKQFGNAAA
jgi:DNA-binding MarR family transcriptional regulator